MGFQVESSVAKHSFQHKLRFWLIAGAVGAICFFLGSGPVKASEPTRSTEAVQTELENFFKVFLGRNLSQNELDQVTREFITSFGSSTCTAECVRTLNINQRHLAVMKAKPGQPEDLVIRQAYLYAGYFSPKVPEGRLFERLINEPDPIRLVDRKTKRLMTQRDIVALANLGIFIKSDGLPKHHSFSSEEIDEAVVVLTRILEPQRMPILFLAAAELWAGIQHHWSALSASEQQSVRNYIQDQSDQPLPTHLYSQLFGISSDAAQRLRTREQLDEIRGTLSRFMRVQGQAVTTNTVIQGLQGVIE